jgi:glucose/arabinose dehydrogenase
VAANPTRTVIARYSVTSNNLNLADKNSETIVLEITQPFANHKGGQIAFGPDGFLYIGMGDGGSEGDPLGNGQNCSSMLGKILRIDVNKQSQSRSYSVPIDNPFIGNALGYCEEIFAYGFRNPWRFSFDNVTGKLWVGDVGQDRLEEIDLVEKGNNYGWNIMEGNFCYNPSNGCNITGLELPVYEYNHSLGNAIIGGYVYRGPSLSSLVGSYVYGDYGSGKIWGLNGSGVNLLLVDSNLVLSSFGVDDNNELYFCAFNGKVYNLSMGVVPEFSPVTIVVLLVMTTTLVFLFFRKRRVSLRAHSFGLQNL